MILTLSGEQNAGKLIACLRASDLFENYPEEVIIFFTSDCFLYPQAIAMLVTWTRKAINSGCDVKFFGNNNIMNYLARMNFFVNLNITGYEETFTRYSEKGRFIPIINIVSEESVFDASNQICELFVQHFDDAQALLPAVEWSVFEVIDNIKSHSKSNIPGFVLAQAYPNLNRLIIAIYDYGIGIKNSLCNHYEINNDREAIFLALEKGITSSGDIGRGNGLAGTKEIIKKNKGKLAIMTGDTVVSISENSSDPQIGEIPFYQGTGIILEFDTQNKVNLDETFIGKSSVNFLSHSCEAISSSGLIVKNECINFASRDEAKRLRNKIENLLPSMEGPMQLNFVDIRITSSSFMDELVAKLFAILGKENFQKRVIIVGMNQDLQNILAGTVGNRF